MTYVREFHLASIYVSELAQVLVFKTELVLVAS